MVGHTLNYDWRRVLLAWQKLYINLFEHPKDAGLKNVTFETNTTQPYTTTSPTIPDNDRIPVLGVVQT